MALPPTTVAFPDQAAIVAYFENHPLKSALNTSFIASIAPDSIQKVANCFACKVMPREAIRHNIEDALTDPVERKKLQELLRTISEYVQSCQANESALSKFTHEVEQIHAGIQCPAKFVVAVALFEQAINDLLDHAAYTPSPSGDGSWVKRIPQ